MNLDLWQGTSDEVLSKYGLKMGWGGNQEQPKKAHHVWLSSKSMAYGKGSVNSGVNSSCSYNYILASLSLLR